MISDKYNIKTKRCKMFHKESFEKVMALSDDEWQNICDVFLSQYNPHALKVIINNGIDGTLIIWQNGKRKSVKGMIEEYLKRYCLENGIPVKE